MAMHKELMKSQLKKMRPSVSAYNRHHIENEIQNLLSEMFTYYGYKRETQAALWAKRILDKDITIHECEKAMDYTVMNLDRPPALADFLTIVSNNSDRPSEELEQERLNNEKARLLREQTAKWKDMFIEKYSQEQLDKLLAKWYEGVTGTTEEMLGFTYRTFEPIFFQDLIEAKGNLERAIEIGISKKCTKTL